MGISVETANRLLASFRGYAQFGAGVVTAFGVVSAGNQKEVIAAIDQIYNGTLLIVTGSASIWQIVIVPAGAMASVALARWSSTRAKVANQAGAVKAAILDPNTPITGEVAHVISSSAEELAKQ